MSNIENQTKKEYLPWINGLKGIACMGVLLHHYFLGTMSAVYFGAEMPSKTASGIDVWLASSPAGFFLNGNYHVCVFLVISAFLLSRQVFGAMKKEDGFISKISDMVGKRYFRLLVPIGFFSLLNWILIKVLTVTNLNFSGKTTDLSFVQLISHIVVRVWTIPDSELLGPLWMIYYLFVGSFIAILLSLMAGKDRKWIFILYLFSLFFFVHSEPYYYVIVLGVILAYLTERTKLLDVINQKKGLFLGLGILFLALTIYFGGYPSYFFATSPAYHYLNPLKENVNLFYVVMHGIAAFLLILSVLFIKPFAKFLSLKFFTFLGDISFSVYLIHIMVIEYLGYYLVDFFTGKIGFIGAIWSSLLICTALTIGLSFVSKLTIERFGEFLVKKLFRS